MFLLLIDGIASERARPKRPGCPAAGRSGSNSAWSVYGAAVRRVSVTLKPAQIQLQILPISCAHQYPRGICSRGPEEYNEGGYCFPSRRQSMRPVICALFAVVASTCSAFTTARVTLILQFDAAHSEQSVSEMKNELQSLMRNAGVELSWRRIGELSSSDSFPSVVVVTFHGSCEMKPLAPPLPSEPVALASTHVSDGHIIPFADVECDHI